MIGAGTVADVEGGGAGGDADFVVFAGGISELGAAFGDVGGDETVVEVGNMLVKEGG